MCTISQSGYNQYWKSMTSGTNLDICKCGNQCHKEYFQDYIKTNERIVILTTDKLYYVSQDTYAKCKEFINLDYKNYPSEVVDAKTLTKFTHLEHSSYINNTNKSKYTIKQWRYKYDDR